MTYFLTQLHSPPHREGFGVDQELVPSDAVRNFVFMANLAAQEATGDAAASTSPERVLNRLKGSTESRTLLFPVVAGAAPLGQVSELGVPLVSATGDTPEMDTVGFIHISLPLLEELDNAEIECVLDVEFLPLPGQPLEPEAQELCDWMAGTALDLARKLGRTVAQVGVLYPAGGEPTYDPMSGSYHRLGFSTKHSEHQMRIAVPDNPASPLLPAGIRPHVWRDYDIPAAFLNDVLELLTVASADAPHGTLHVEPIRWTPRRLEEAHARLRDRKAHTLLIALTRGETIVALSELSRQEHGDPEVAEWTLTVTAREQRRQGLARLAKLTALGACARLWPEVTRTYTSVAGTDVAMEKINLGLGAEVISTSQALEKAL